MKTKLNFCFWNTSNKSNRTKKKREKEMMFALEKRVREVTLEVVVVVVGGGNNIWRGVFLPPLFFFLYLFIFLLLVFEMGRSILNSPVTGWTPISKKWAEAVHTHTHTTRGSLYTITTTTRVLLLLSFFLSRVRQVKESVCCLLSVRMAARYLDSSPSSSTSNSSSSSAATTEK